MAVEGAIELCTSLTVDVQPSRVIDLDGFPLYSRVTGTDFLIDIFQS